MTETTDTNRESFAEIRHFGIIVFTQDFSCIIGRSEDAQLCYNTPEVSAAHARLTLCDGTLTIEDLDSTNGTLLNKQLLHAKQPYTLQIGDVIQISNFILMVGNSYVVANCRESVPLEASILGAVTLEHSKLKEKSLEPAEPTGSLKLFYPAPRLMHSIHKRAFTVDSPPPAAKRDESPAIMQLGPSFIMGLASVFTVANTVGRLAGGENVTSTLPMLAMSVSMIAGMLIWPIISKRYERRRLAREEARRESAYTDYLNAIEHTLHSECDIQSTILAENRTTVEELLTKAQASSLELMNRTSAHSDFLDLRVGTGDLPLEADIRWPSEQFSVDTDHLLSKVIEVSRRPPKLSNVALAFNPASQYVAGVVGPREQTWAFVRGLVVQICSLMSYQDVKIMLVADEDEEAEWHSLRFLPHLFDDAGRTRFLATNSQELLSLTMRLERDLERKSEAREEDALEIGPRTIVLCANKELTDPSETISRLSRLRSYRGISLIFMGNVLSELPRECDYVIDLAGDSPAGAAPTANIKACMFDRADVSGTMMRFVPDISIDTQRMHAFVHNMARVRLDVAGQRTALPTSLGFLEMCKVGNVGQLNIAKRWDAANASRTLQASVGQDAQGGDAIINMHEKAHGPHGLIAGTTGSGKSEFIITFVLSLAASYPPDQVSFVLIDYKGGGLAGAFENDRYRLPHLAGTITNLDGEAISRSLISIKSELKRRQALLSAARERTGEATMDIYKYLSYYLAGTLTEPLPHLFLIADEFAELKDQQPEFMDELMSAARIGRSLGVHLILATQKPSGVVNDQIRSNMHLKVCLKVADASDSKEMIGRSDAADIREPGRYHMLVGYNEYFATGQAAYAGSAYAPVAAYEPKHDNTIELIDNEGVAIVAIRPETQATTTGLSEINAVLEEIEATAQQQQVFAKRLWLDPLPRYISLDALHAKYGDLSTEEEKKDFTLLLGELDDPAHQIKHALSLSLQQDGNAAFYGDSSSGIELAVAAMLTNACKQYSSQELNTYILDFGSGLFKAFEDAPQVGDVVVASEEDRVERLFDMLGTELERRREMLTPFGGSYSRHVSQGNVCPRVLLLLNGMAVFNEMYDKYEQALLKLLREGAPMGIHAILCASMASDVRVRLRSCIKNSLLFTLASDTDYIGLLGSIRGIVLPHQSMRGLVKQGDAVYIFQAAGVSSDLEDDPFTSIQNAIAKQDWSNCAHRAPRIPLLPTTVNVEMFEGALNGLAVPIGLDERNLDPIMFDFIERPIERVLYTKQKEACTYLATALSACCHQTKHKILLADYAGTLTSLCDDAKFTYWNADEVLEEVHSLCLPKNSEGTAEKLLVVSGIGTFLNRSDPQKTKIIRDYLLAATAESKIKVLLFDLAYDASYTQEPWYKTHIGSKRALWLGEGLDSQNLVQISYAMGQKVASKTSSDQGYLVDGGSLTKIKLIQPSERKC